MLNVTDVDVEIDDILAGIAAGDPISLSVLDTDGNLLAPGSDCNVAADSFSLDASGGIAIGGNAITGLGDTDELAESNDIDAIALGNRALADVGAVDSIAIGADATVTAANSVALGSGSLADRGAQTGYTAPGLTGTFDSAGTVSVGSAGNLRQITNVAPGTEDSDAATVGQVTGAVAALADDAVLYDDDPKTSVTLAGTGGTTIANVADGTLSDTSDEAVNGSQLFATNQDVAQNAADITDIDTRVTTNTTNITNVDGRVTVNEGDIADLQDAQALSVQYTDATQTEVALGGAGGTTISNVADGELSATSDEAVNGSQLFATNQQVDQNTTDIANLDGRVTTNETNIANIDGRVTTNTTNIANIDGRVTSNTTNITNLDNRVTTNEGDIANLQDAQALSVQYTDATQTEVALGGAGGTTISNVADGELSATSDEAVNGSQLFATNQQVDQNAADITNIDNRVTTNETDIANIDNRVTVNEGDIANIGDRVTVNEGDIANIDDRVTVNEGDISDLDVRVTDNTTNITNIQAQVDNVPVGYVSDSDPTMASSTPTQTVAVIGADDTAPVTLTNVAPAALNAASTDAVNGSQLYATNQNVADNRTDIDQNTADITTINNNLQGSTVVAVQYSDPDNPTVSNGGTITNDVALIGADSSVPVVLHNVAAGSLPNDAVNLQQLQDSLQMSMDYTDMRFEQFGYDLQQLSKDANGGTANAMAAAGLPQVIESDGRMVAGAVGHYRGQTAFALGASAAFNDGRAVAKFNGSVNTRGHAGISAGAGFAF